MGVKLDLVRLSPFWMHVITNAPDDWSVDDLEDELKKLEDVHLEVFIAEEEWNDLDSFMWAETPQGIHVWHKYHVEVKQWRL